jgi:acid phosphatase family membrane protein YuiD
MVNNVFYDNIILIPTIAFFIAVIFKWFVVKVKTWKLNLGRALWSWGMPSVHTWVVISLATAFALKHWIASDFFAIVMAYTAVIIYDAINVRFEAWLHAEAINKSIWKKKFKESLWHLPSEAFAWSILGIFVAVILYYL